MAIIEMVGAMVTPTTTTAVAQAAVDLVEMTEVCNLLSAKIKNYMLIEMKSV